MTLAAVIDRFLTRYPIIAALSYASLVVCLFLTALFSVIDVVARHGAVIEAAERLARFEHAKTGSPSEAGGVSASNDPEGAPFLEGETLTIASAALLQRVASAITKSGGNVVSSEVVPHDAKSTDPFVRVSAAFEIEQRSLLPVLYDLEAGIPFLFVDQLQAEAPEAASQRSQMRVILQVSGLWPGAKSK